MSTETSHSNIWASYVALPRTINANSNAFDHCVNNYSNWTESTKFVDCRFAIDLNTLKKSRHKDISTQNQGFPNKLELKTYPILALIMIPLTAQILNLIHQSRLCDASGSDGYSSQCPTDQVSRCKGMEDTPELPLPNNQSTHYLITRQPISSSISSKLYSQCQDIVYIILIALQINYKCGG